LGGKKAKPPNDYENGETYNKRQERRMRLLYKFHPTKVKQNFFLFLLVGAFIMEQFKKNKTNKIQLYIKSE